VSTTDGSLNNIPVTGVTEAPCPAGDYWGDYDAMTVGNNNPNAFGIGGSLAFLLRYVTDSTGGTCTASGTPQHVTVTLGDPNQ
jgi:hypothetical protein